MEALKFLVSEAATVAKHEEEKAMMINDVARAFFEAPAKRDICIELPNEAKTKDDEEQDMVGKLVQSLYGTRDAAKNFQDEVKDLLTGLGYSQGRYNPCTYYHQGRRLKTLVHGDDFVSVGGRESLCWLRARLEERFEIKTKVIGRHTGERREDRILNRVVRVTDKGWEYEADQRHADLLIEALNLKEANGVRTRARSRRDGRQRLTRLHCRAARRENIGS